MFNNLVSPQGRMRRLHFLIGWFVLSVIGNVLDHLINRPGSSTLLYVFYVPFAWMFIAMMVQRAHDAGRNGKFVATALGLMFGSAIVLVGGAAFLGDETETSIPSIIGALIIGAAFLCGLIMTLIVYFAPGNPEANRYGPNPRTREGALAEAGGSVELKEPLNDLAARRGFDTGQ